MWEIKLPRRQWQPIPVLLPGKSLGWRSLVGCSPCGHSESDTTEWLNFHFSLSCIGEGNGNPLQCSCLENPKDVGAWWAAVYGVTQSQTRLKRLSSSSSSRPTFSSLQTTTELGSGWSRPQRLNCLPNTGAHSLAETAQGSKATRHHQDWGLQGAPFDLQGWVAKGRWDALNLNNISTQWIFSKQMLFSNAQ